MSSVSTYSANCGQVPDPLALNVQCNKHGQSAWATCDCNRRYFANIERSYVSGDILYTDIESRRDDFKNFSAACTWAEKEVKRLNK